MGFRVLAPCWIVLIALLLAPGRAEAIPGPYVLYFDFGSAELTPLSRQRLDEIVEALRMPNNLSTVTVMAGHTDAFGPPAPNMRLACARVRAAADYLRGKGISPSR